MIESTGLKASVIIPTRNGMPLVERCLRGVLAQETPWPFEVIVVDSASTDGTWELLESMPVQRMRINPQDFNHGATRNLAAQQARGEFLVFLVQDAIPADGAWLANLIAAFDEPHVAGAYSRQRPRHESTPITKYMTVGTTPDAQDQQVQTLPEGTTLDRLPPVQRFQLALFQNNSSCVRRSVFCEHPFPVVPYGEDIAWGKRVIEAGYSLKYEPTSVVYHSHDRSPLYALKRAYADHYQAAELFGMRMLPSVARLLRTIVWSSMDAWRYIIRTSAAPQTRIRYGLAAPVYMAALGIGQFLGAKAGARPATQRWMRRLDRQLRVGV